MRKYKQVKRQKFTTTLKITSIYRLNELAGKENKNVILEDLIDREWEKRQNEVETERRNIQ